MLLNMFSVQSQKGVVNNYGGGGGGGGVNKADLKYEIFWTT